MAELVPFPLEHHVARLMAEWRTRRAIFDLPERGFWNPAPGCDLSVSFHGERAATPAGPAAGPQSQLAQNLVLCWLAGGRILELKTVQINDRLEIPRPCIDVRNVGYNVEWSQELRLAESLSEYVNGWVLIALLRALGIPSAEAAQERGDTVFDMSVGYDLAGIRSDSVRRWMDSLRDAGTMIDERRGALPVGRRDIEIPSAISNTITLSTFHGCPADEIEKICEFLLCEVGVHTIVKLNPTLLGFDEVQDLLGGVLGYRQLRLDPDAFAQDLQFKEGEQMVGRLSTLAAQRGLGFGVKFSNTLVVKNHDDYFKDEVMYLSGQPLHVLATTLALRFRDAVGSDMPISFSAGIDQTNFANAVAMGFVPVTSSTDLLRTGGYARMARYLASLERKMAAAGAATIDEFILATAQQSLAPVDERPEVRARAVRDAAHRNARGLVTKIQGEVRYRQEKNDGAPRKIGSNLELFDCISCDKCVPVCPNDANFVYETRPRSLQLDELRWSEGAFSVRSGKLIEMAGAHQIGNWADFCNECGNCDIFCPEDGGPFIQKPRFFSNLDDWRADGRTQAFHLVLGDGVVFLHGRLGGGEYLLELDPVRGVARFSDGALTAELTATNGALRRAEAAPDAPPDHTLALGPGREMLALLCGVLDLDRPSPVNAPLLTSSG